MNEQTSRIVEDFRWLPPVRESAFGPWAWVGVIILLLAVAAAVVFVLRRKNVPLPFLAPPLPHETALRELRELSGLLREGMDQEFVRRVSRVLRVYIQERFGIRAPHRSTEEFLHEARQSEALDDDQRRLLQGFLAQCDLVKFARHRVVLSEMQALFHAAREFVEGTIPREPAAAGVEK